MTTHLCMGCGAPIPLDDVEVTTASAYGVIVCVSCDAEWRDFEADVLRAFNELRVKREQRERITIAPSAN